MSYDAAVDLIRSLSDGISEGPAFGNPGGPPDGWESFAVILAFGEGTRSAHGYAYGPADAITAVSRRWPSIEAAADAYLRSQYAPDQPLPVKILVQFDRTAGQFAVDFEDADESRWSVTPATIRSIREELRPRFAESDGLDPNA